MNTDESPSRETAVRSSGATELSVDAVLEKMRVPLEVSARPFGDTAAQINVLLAETLPFVESAFRAEDEGPFEVSVSWHEARSFAWLLAYRLGDQGWPAHVAAMVVPAWREAVGSAWAARAADDVSALILEGFNHGREDRARTEMQQGLAAALPVAEVARHVVLIVAAGPLDPDGARTLADRASSYLLRRDARAALLDLEGLIAPTAAVLVELWSIPSAARMLGVRMVVSGMGGIVGEIAKTSNLHDEGEIRLSSLAQGMERLLCEAGIVLGGPRGFGAWIRGLLAPARSLR